MRFLFLIGVEGSGHHLIRAVLKDFLALKQVIDLAECQWHKMLINHWDPDVQDRSLTNKLVDKLIGPKPLKDRIFASMEQDRTNGVTHYFEPASFPFGQPRNTLRRPDLIEFFEWFDGCLKIKPLVLYRDPVSATYSALRRDFTDDWELQARITEDNYLYIVEQMETCGADVFRVLCVEEFLADPEPFVSALADWWEIDPGLIHSGLRNIIPPTERNQIPEEIGRSLEMFFSEQRRGKWAQLHAVKTRLRRSIHAD